MFTRLLKENDWTVFSAFSLSVSRQCKRLNRAHAYPEIKGTKVDLYSERGTNGACIEIRGSLL